MPRFLLDATRDPLKNLSGREIAVTLQPPTPDLAPSPITETLPEYCVSKLPGLLVLSSANVPSPRSPPVTRITAATSTPPGTPGFEQARKTSLRLGPVISEGGWGIVYKAQELSVAPSQAPPLSRASSSATASSVTTARRTSALEAARQPFLNDPESLDDVPSASRRQCLAETPSPTAGAGVPISTTASKLRKLLLRSLFVNSPDQKKQQFAVKVLKRAKADSNSPLSIKERTLQDTEARNHMRASSSGHSGIVKLWGVMCDDEEEAVDGNHDYPFIDNQTDDVEDREPVLDGHEPEMRRGMFTMKAPHSAKGKEKAKATVISRSRTRPRTVLDGKMFLVMDYCEGGDLYEAIEKGKYYNNIPATSSIILQLFSAIEHLHGMGIYHRDLKPENILLMNKFEAGAEPSVAIADFGLSSTNPHSVEKSGSSQYMSPEALGRYDGPFYTSLLLPIPDLGKPQLIPIPVSCSDIWSLGIIIIALTLPRLLPWSEALETASPAFKEYTTDTGRWFLRRFYVSEEMNVLLKGMLELNPWERSSIPDARRNFSKLVPRWMVSPPSISTSTIPISNSGTLPSSSTMSQSIQQGHTARWNLYSDAPRSSSYFQLTPPWRSDPEMAKFLLSRPPYSDANVARKRREAELDFMEGRYIPPGYRLPTSVSKPKDPRSPSAASLPVHDPVTASRSLYKRPPRVAIPASTSPPSPTHSHLLASSIEALADKSEDELQVILNMVASGDGASGYTSSATSSYPASASATIAVQSHHFPAKDTRTSHPPITQERSGSFMESAPSLLADSTTSSSGTDDEDEDQNVLASREISSVERSTGVPGLVVALRSPNEERRRSFPTVGRHGEIVDADGTETATGDNIPEIRAVALDKHKVILANDHSNADHVGKKLPIDVKIPPI